MAAYAIPPDLLGRLDEQSVESLVVYLAGRLGALDGNRFLKFQLTDGRLRESGIDRSRISNGELERIGAAS